MSNNTGKDHLRRTQKRDRISLTEQERQGAERAICAFILSLCRSLRTTRNAHTQAGDPITSRALIAMYAATQGEVDISPCFQTLRAENYSIVFPRVIGSGHMVMCLVDEWQDLVPGAFGIFEPGVEAERVEPDELSVLLVPGLAFSPVGGRIGYGGGYYDRFLDTCSKNVLCVGICFHRQLTGDVPLEAHDHKMDYIVTEQGVVDCRKT